MSPIIDSLKIRTTRLNDGFIEVCFRNSRERIIEIYYVNETLLKKIKETRKLIVTRNWDVSYHKQSRKYFNSIMNYNFEEGIFTDIKEESVFLGLDFQLESLKEEGLKLLFKIENFDRRNVYTTGGILEDRLIDTDEDVDSKPKVFI